MKNVTQATENRIKKMVKDSHKYGEAMQSILDEMKSREGWYGATISEMKKYGYELENSTQISVSRYYDCLYLGLTVLYNSLFSATFTNDLHYANIYDFNKLVKIISELPYNGYGAF